MTTPQQDQLVAFQGRISTNALTVADQALLNQALDDIIPIWGFGETGAPPDVASDAGLVNEQPVDNWYAVLFAVAEGAGGGPVPPPLPIAGDVDGTLAMSWVAAIHGAFGLGGTVPVGRTIQLTWDPAIAISTLQPIKVISSDPAKGPFGITVEVGGAGPGTDQGIGIGYNGDFSAPANELQALFNVESDFQSGGPSSRQVEIYWQVARPDVSVFVRPFSATVLRSDGSTNIGASWVDGASASQFGLQGGSHASPSAEVVFNTGQTNYLHAPGAYLFNFVNAWHTMATEFTITTTDGGLSNVINTAGPLTFETANVWILQSTFVGGFAGVLGADAVVLQDHAGGGGKMFWTTNGADGQFLPFANNSGNLGTVGANQWKSLATGAVAAGQRTVTANTTVTATDYTIWIDSSGGGFNINLPAPNPAIVGRLLLVVDVGNSLATHHVTLTLSGGNINGVGAPLSLLTSGAAYMVTTDGSNSWVTKMALGG